MSDTQLKYTQNKVPVKTSLIVAVIVTTLLFYIDEGYYNFNWTKHFANWIYYVIYIGSIFCGQLLTWNYILKKYAGARKTIWTSVIGTPVGLTLLFIVGFSIRHLVSPV